MVVKKRLKSKTYWLGLITIVTGQIMGNPDLLGPYLGDHAALVLFVLGIAAMIVREFTDVAVEDKE